MSIAITVTDTAEFARFDVLSVDYGPEATVTEHPVEFGAEVTDHVQIRPIRLTVEIFVTSSPLGPIPQPLAVQDAIGFFERALGKVSTIAIDGEGTFSPIVLEAFPHTRTAREGRNFSLRYKFIRIAQGISVKIPPRMPAPVAAAGAPSKVDLGECATTPGEPTGVPTSTLREGGDAIVSGSAAAATLVADLAGF